jgi:hypothetical protein
MISARRLDMTPTTKTARNTLAAALVLGAMSLSASNAFAVSSSVKMACMSDYFAHCSSHRVGSSSLRQCMRNVGSGLSKRCVNALVAAGEVSKKEVSRRKSMRRGVASRGR